MSFMCSRHTRLIMWRLFRLEQEGFLEKVGDGYRPVASEIRKWSKNLAEGIRDQSLRMAPFITALGDIETIRIDR